jgi:hypothetical protein
MRLIGRESSNGYFRKLGRIGLFELSADIEPEHLICVFRPAARLRACPELIERPSRIRISTNGGYTHDEIVLRDHWTNYLNL